MKFLHHKKTQDQKIDFNKKRPFFKRMGRDVHVDWSLNVLFSTIVMIVLVIMGFLLRSSFNANLNAEKKAVVSKDNSVSDNIALDKVLEKYNKRASTKAALIQNYIGPNDPSI
jgi:hypothetical protein